MTEYNPIELLQQMIATPSVSRHEHQVSALVNQHLRRLGVDTVCHGLNITALASGYNPQLPTLMLNSHLDTVSPSAAYTRNPYCPEVLDGRLYGLGSNDAGASVVSLIGAFLALKDRPLPLNLLLALTVEEEMGGENGMRALLPALAQRGLTPQMAIVGEPTSLHPAIAERGLVVLDCVTHGSSGHAARNEGINAIYRAMADIDTLRALTLPKVSDILGPVKITITQIQAGTQHNVVPDQCCWVADIRTTDAYTNAETVERIRRALSPHTIANPRSTRIGASVIHPSHPLVSAAGGTPFVSPTTSDMCFLQKIPALKIGPGDSCRSHTANEWVAINDIYSAISKYQHIILSLK